MTAETDFRAALVAHAPLVAVVDGRIALNALPEGGGVPAVVFTVAHSRTHAIDGTLLTDQCSITAECWAGTAVEANQVADLVTAALSLEAYPALLPRGPQVLERSTAVDADAGLDAAVLTIEWWA